MEDLKLLSAALNAAQNGVLIADRQGTIVWINRGFTQLTGYTQDEAIGRKPNILKSGKHDKAFFQKLWTTILDGQVFKSEMTNRRKDGSTYVSEHTISPVTDARGAITHFIGIQDDISELKRLQDQLQQSQKLEAFGQLAGGVAHDFNNLMTIVTGYGSLALKGLPQTAPQRRHIESMIRAGERAVGLTRQLLAFSRRQAVSPFVLNINKIVEDSSKMFKRIIGEEFELSLALHPELGNARLDPVQLEQVLMNLIVNARDAMPGGGKLFIETDNAELDAAYLAKHPQAKPGRYVRLTVTDTGHGMDERTQARIFEPFFTTKEQGKGTGMGLATVYGIVKQSGGYIWVYSAPGQGASFKVYFPRVDAVVEKSQHSSGGRRAVAAGIETILVVEDEKEVRLLTQSILVDLGYRVLLAENGRQALEIVRAEKGAIDLIATDMVMPEMSGKDLIEQVQKEFPEIKVLLVSGFGAHPLMQSGSLPPDVPWMEKPYMPNRFAAKVREILDG